MLDVANDPSREPLTPNEIYFENWVRSDYERTYDEPDDPKWDEIRQGLYLDMAEEMMTLRWIDENEWDIVK